MHKIVCLFNHKGGVSKTTTAFNLGWMLATKGKASCEIVTHSNRATARLAREMGLMKGAAARAATKTGLFCQVLVDQDQLLEKLDIGKDGVAHCGQSEVVRNRRLPQKECLFKFLAGGHPAVQRTT